MIVTDHALTRWLTRAHGIDMEQMRAELAAIAQPYADAGVKHAFVGGVWFVFENDKLVTVTPQKPHVESTMRNDRHHANGTDMDLRKNPFAAKRHKMRKKRRHV